MIIAIDGHSSCGKSTIAKGIAQALNFVYIDTGAMYRAVTLYAMQCDCFRHCGLDPQPQPCKGQARRRQSPNGEEMLKQVQHDGSQIDEKKLAALIDDIHIHFEVHEHSKAQQTYLNGTNVEDQIRTLEVANWVSEISKIAFVRTKMVALQQSYASHKNIVMDGRDIGTVVFPNADFKFFVTASAQVRAQRRYDELQAKGEHVNFDEVLHNIEQRDFIDSTRSESPLRQADDAVLVDTSNMTREEQLTWILHYIAQHKK